jgi:nitrosocyanin
MVSSRVICAAPTGKRSVTNSLETEEVPVHTATRHHRHPGWYAFALLLVVLLAYAGTTAAAEAKKFTLINVIFDGTKVWLPSTIAVQAGDEVELTLINKLDDPHGFKIDAFGVEEVVQPKGKSTVKFTASKTGIHPLICHLHPPHIGGQLLVLSQ